MTQTLCRYFSLLFKQNFAWHFHDCFWLSTLTTLPVTYTFRDWVFDQKLCEGSKLSFLVPKVTCSTEPCRLRVSLCIAINHQRYLTKARIFKLHQPPVWSFHSPAIQRGCRAALVISPSRLLKPLFILHCRPIFSKQQNGPDLAEANIWSSCAKCDMPALKSRVRLILNLDLDYVGTLPLVRKYFNIYEVGVSYFSQHQPITRPQTLSPDAHTQILLHLSSLSLTLVKWPKSCSVCRVLHASILAHSLPPVPRSPMKICTTFAMKQQATLHNVCASRVFIRTRRAGRVEESSAFDDQHAAGS